ncbi:23602_t:CDS:2, partial [Cetraspora pellucida]
PQALSEIHAQKSNSIIIKNYFNKLNKIIQDNLLTLNCIWNMNETGFVIASASDDYISSLIIYKGICAISGLSNDALFITVIETRIDNIIKEYLATLIKLNRFIRSTISSQKTKNPEITAGSSSRTAILKTIPIEEEIRNNATAQKHIASSKEIAEKKIKELEQIYNFTSDLQLLHDLYNRIKSLRTDIQSHEKKMQKLKRNAEYQSKCHSKKTKAIVERQEYRSADARRRKKAIKVRIAHHHPAWIAVAGVLHNETKYHPDGHYCLASVKGARQFAQTFAEFSVIISQDDKAKISLGIAAVGRTFHTLQSSFQP